jgi:hypothetical protein
MSTTLKRHPESQGGEGVILVAEGLRVDARRLTLRYRLTGATDAVVIPPMTRSERTDELWRRTCLEAFIARPGGGYYEFNFAPSTQWAAYGFDGYRSAMAPAEPVPTPSFTAAEEDGYALHVDLDLAGLADLPSDEPWRVSLTAVLEHADGGRSYWALAHAAGKPDFHHPDSFVLDLPAPA